MAKPKPPKTVIPSQSKSKPDKRKSGHFQREDRKLSPPPKRTKNSNNDRAASTPQHASLHPRPPTNASRDFVPAIALAVDDAWKQAFRVEEMSIITSSSIQKKVSRVVDVIMVPTAPKSSAVVELHAKGPATAKMITVVEITKRQIGLGKGRWFQYNKVEQVMVEREEDEKKDRGNKRKGKGGEGGDIEEDSDEEEGEDEAFETMKTPFERANEGRPKVRSVPVMTIYLSQTRIEELRKAYGEQTNTLEGSKA